MDESQVASLEANWQAFDQIVLGDRIFDKCTSISTEGILSDRLRSKLSDTGESPSMEFPMSAEAVPVQPTILITIIAESVLQDRLIKLLKSHKVSGYTISSVRGEGGHGKRMGDIAGYNTNIEIKTLVSPEVSDTIMSDLKENQDGHGLIAYRHNVEALSD